MKAFCLVTDFDIGPEGEELDIVGARVDLTFEEAVELLEMLDSIAGLTPLGLTFQLREQLRAITCTKTTSRSNLHPPEIWDKVALLEKMERAYHNAKLPALDSRRYRDG